MEYLKKQVDFINEDIKWKFWEKDREKMELELVDAINKMKVDFTLVEDGLEGKAKTLVRNLGKYKNSLSKLQKKFRTIFEYSEKNDGIMNETLRDYLDDVLEIINKMGEFKVLQDANLGDMYGIKNQTRLLNNLWHEIDVK